MTGDGFVQEAVAELYSSDPDEFIARRGVLAAQARSAGEASAAKRISALRKPTRSAWVVNLLVRSAPAVTSELTALGEELRAAQEALDGTAIRELSQRRRQLVDALARQAFTVSGQESPPAALRDEVTATLGAALADPQIAEQLRTGALERAARSDGFGSATAPPLALVPSPSGSRRAPGANGAPAPARRRAPAAKDAAASARPAAKDSAASARPAVKDAAASPRSAAKDSAASARPAAKVTALATARARAERERRRQAIAEAELAMGDADRAERAASRAEQEHETTVQVMEERLVDARQRLAEARVQARRARTEQRQARRALDRLQRAGG